MQRVFIEDDHMVQTLAAYRSDDTFHVCALPRRSRSAEHFVDVHDLELLAELLPVDPISVSEQIFRRGVERKSFAHLLCGPFGCGMGCDVEVDNAASVVRENNKDEEDFKPNRVDREEVDRRELRLMVRIRSRVSSGT